MRISECEARNIEHYRNREAPRPCLPPTTPYESQLVPADDSRERRSTGLLNIYYNAVIACIRDAESILIFGPGEAKGELKKRLQRNKLGGRIVAIETIDRMTDRQIAAKVRRYFQENRDKQGHL